MWGGTNMLHIVTYLELKGWTQHRPLYAGTRALALGRQTWTVSKSLLILMRWNYFIYFENYCLVLILTQIRRRKQVKGNWPKLSFGQVRSVLTHNYNRWKVTMNIFAIFRRSSNLHMPRLFYYCLRETYIIGYRAFRRLEISWNCGLRDVWISDQTRRWYVDRFSN